VITKAGEPTDLDSVNFWSEAVVVSTWECFYRISLFELWVYNTQTISVAASCLTIDRRCSTAGFKYWGEHQDDAVYLKFSVGLT